VVDGKPDGRVLVAVDGYAVRTAVNIGYELLIFVQRAAHGHDCSVEHGLGVVGSRGRGAGVILRLPGHA
jgi:hypothetical protein